MEVCFWRFDQSVPPLINQRQMTISNRIWRKVLLIALRLQSLESNFCLTRSNEYFFIWSNNNVPLTWYLYSLILIYLWGKFLSYKNQSTELLCKSMGWFLYYGDLRHEVVNEFISIKDYDVSKFQKQSLGGVPLKRSLHKKYSYSKLFWSASSRIWTEYGEIRSTDFFHAAGVLESFTKSAGKHLCGQLLFNKVASFRPATLLKRDSDTDVFLWVLQNF